MLIVNDIGRLALALVFAVLIRGDGLGAVPLTVYAQPEPVGLPPLMRTDAGGQICNVRELLTSQNSRRVDFAL